jgi:hypothetical protein
MSGRKFLTGPVGEEGAVRNCRKKLEASKIND